MRIAFLPYQAAMWDSLESIYEAARQDETVETLVMPLPYAKLDSEGGVVHHNPGEQLFDVPEAVAASWDILAKFAPDVVYVHNVYDGGNRVTRVDSQFHTHRLKRLGCTVVYVPYFFMGITVPPAQRSLPGYREVDVIAMPSQSQANQLAPEAKSKALTLGTPKSDRVQAAFAGGDTDRGGMTVLLVVLSITEVLQWGAGVFVRLAEIFDLAARHEGIKFIWRPHPLIVSTIISMRPELGPAFKDLLLLASRLPFVDVDLAADYAPSLVAADGCVAFSATSLPLMYGLSGRPVFFMSGGMDGREVSASTARHTGPPQFGQFENLHPYACAETNGDVSLERFLEYLRDGEHNGARQVSEYENQFGAIDGTAGARIHAAVKERFSAS